MRPKLTHWGQSALLSAPRALAYPNNSVGRPQRWRKMYPVSSVRVSKLFLIWGQGDQIARDALIPLVYDGLRRLTRRHLRRERPDHTLQSAAQVREVYLSIEQTAVVMGISPATAKGEWATARAWLQREMKSKGKGTRT